MTFSRTAPERSLEDHFARQYLKPGFSLSRLIHLAEG